jgi:hypothetical protein
LNNTPSAIFGSSFTGDSAWYSSPQVDLPPFPPGGIYEVNYKTEPQQFLMPSPACDAHQVIMHPGVSVNGSNILQQISWTFRDTNGASVGTPAFVDRINVRVDGFGGRLFDADLTPDQTSVVVDQTVSWTNVSSIQMVYNDTLNNQYVTFWNRTTQPLQIITSNLPNATVGLPYHYLMLGAGGLTPYSWSLLSSNLPAGLTFTPVTGEIGGTPTVSGSYALNVRVTDSNGQNLDKTLSLNIAGSAQPLTLQPLPITGTNRFGVRVLGETGHSYSLQYTTNFVDWMTLFTTNGSGANIDLIDTNATEKSRFYRVFRNP